MAQQAKMDGLKGPIYLTPSIHIFQNRQHVVSLAMIGSASVMHFAAYIISFTMARCPPGSYIGYALFECLPQLWRQLWAALPQSPSILSLIIKFQFIINQDELKDYINIIENKYNSLLLIMTSFRSRTLIILLIIQNVWGQGVFQIAASKLNLSTSSMKTKNIFNYAKYYPS